MTETANNILPPLNQADPFEKTRMSFGDHLLELRSCLVKSLIGITLAFIVSLLFSGHILEFIIAPIAITLEMNGFDPQLTTLSPPEAFITYIKVSLFSGLILSSPWVFHQMWSFIAAGLHANEKKYVNTFVPFSAGLFVLGGLFFIIIVAPISFNYFITFSSGWKPPQNSMLKPFYHLLLGTKPAAAPDPAGNNKTGNAAPVNQPIGTITFTVQKIYPFIININTQPAALSAPAGTSPGKAGESKPAKPLIRSDFTLEKYVNLVTVLSLAFGLSFQMPLAVFLLGRLGLVSVKTLKTTRKYVIFGIVVFAAIITPPDVLSQILMAIPMYFLYEAGILMLVIWPRTEISAPAASANQ